MFFLLFRHEYLRFQDGVYASMWAEQLRNPKGEDPDESVGDGEGETEQSADNPPAQS